MLNGSGPHHYFRDIKVVIGFLTLIRTSVDPPPDMKEVGSAAWAFPVVGMFIGISLVLSYGILSTFLPQAIAVLLTLIVWVIITGGLHLDGWTDCWDAFGVAAPVEKRLEILKDSRLGAFGAVALILLLATKIVALMVMKSPATAFFIAPILGRAMVILASQGAGTSGSGMAAGFLEGVQRRSCNFCWGFSILVGLFAGLAGLLSIASAYVAALWFRRFAESRIGFVNGDVLGSICELVEVTVLIILCAK
ncbi:MAG: adenosylcobinamide-GDP ribazoletransferase [Pseudomonadota bacterium]